MSPLISREIVSELVKRAFTTACPHGKKKTGPCRMCLVLRLTRDIHRLLEDRTC